MAAEKLVKTTEEQAVGAWVEAIVNARLEELQNALDAQNVNLEEALRLVKECKEHIYQDVIENGMGRGGEKGMHGFIAEWLEVYLGNAHKVVAGKLADMKLLDDNGPVDYMVGDVAYQSKFVLKFAGLDAVMEHAQKYPDFVKEGGRYTIPAGFCDHLREIAKVPESQLDQLPVGQQMLWNKLQALKAEGVELDKNLESSAFKFLDAKRNHVDETLIREEGKIREEDAAIRKVLEEKGAPSLEETLQATAIGAALEAGLAFSMGAYKKLKSGKKLTEFSTGDWKDLGVETAWGAAKGGIRGGAVYAMVNFTKLPGSVATATVTAAFGMAGQADQLRQGAITAEEFVINSEAVCLESAVSAVSAMIGQMVVPVPVFGALVGNVVGTMMYEIAQTNLSSYETKMIEAYISEAEEHSRTLEEEHARLVAKVEDETMALQNVLTWAFSAEANIAFPMSIEHARLAGVKEERILKNEEEGYSYFLS